jgi:hypothetical protein
MHRVDERFDEPCYCVSAESPEARQLLRAKHSAWLAVRLEGSPAING